ncbi:MAG: sodium:calcium antiporter [Thermoflavifilum sp.]|nr:sodium:calcium antiporter [Thermoflavifilum sp.]MCL6512895.1 sodium:calcium antiporter [Alicyclobacillus sp.]
MRMVLAMVFGLAMVLFGAELFTNAVEWLGRKWSLGQGALGSILAALGTALPETAVPITAILFGQRSMETQEIGIGGILGAPFLLVTLGFLIMAIALWLSRPAKADDGLDIARRTFHRDMTFFMTGYAVSLTAGALPVAWLHTAVPWLLVGWYCVFFWLTLRDTSDDQAAETETPPLYLQWSREVPSLPAVLLQLMMSLALIIGGAHLLTSGVQLLAGWLRVPPFAVSVLLIPLATELPETLNSVVWIRQGKDALAMGNITGAMVFQSTLVPALGIAMTPWRLSEAALFTGGLTLAAAGFVYGMFRLQGRLTPAVLAWVSVIYGLLPLQTLATRYDLDAILWLGTALVALLLGWVLRREWTPRGA